MSDALIRDLKEERANAIFSFYNNYTNYVDIRIPEDGNPDTPAQELFEDLNNLIQLYHLELESSIGYPVNSAGYISTAEEGDPDSGFWWENSKTSNSTSELFYTDIQSTSYYYRINNKIDPYARHPYLYWNQYATLLGSFDDLSWKNVASRSSYTDTQNPFAAGSNFRMAEPLEYFGDTDNLLWGRIVYDGRWAYRNRYIGNTSYTTRAYTGFYDYETPTRSLTNLADSNLNPSPWSIMRDTRWSSGTNDLPLELVTHTIQNHSGTTTGTFEIPLTESPSLPNAYHTIYNDDTNEIFTFEITGSTTLVSAEQYSYINGTPAITSGDLNSSSARFQSEYPITNHSGSSSGTFRITGDPALTTGWYLICTTNSSYGFVFELTAVNTIITDPTPPISSYEEYTYENALWPTPNSGELDSDHVLFIKLPSIPEIIKTGGTTDGRSHVWQAVYDTYYSTFIGRMNDISTQVDNVLSRLNAIISFDYTDINTVGVAAGVVNDALTETQNFETTLNNWKSSWESLFTSGYSAFDSKWSDSELDDLLDDGNGGIRVLIDFPSGYSSARTGVLYDRVQELYSTLGDYQPGTDEEWLPSQTEAGDNNSGGFALDTLNGVRYLQVQTRLNREDGSLVGALQAWYNYSSKLLEIFDLEDELDVVVNSSEYDPTPENLIVSTDNDDSIVLEWDSVIAASSYQIQYKDGINGAWVDVITTLGYVDPTELIVDPLIVPILVDPPNNIHPVYNLDLTEANEFTNYTHQAYTRGRQSFGLTDPLSDLEAATGLSNDFTVYDFDVLVDSTTTYTIQIRGLDARTWEGLSVAIENYIADNGLPLEVALFERPASITIYSTTKGNGSEVTLSAGSNNDLFASIGATISASESGTTVLMPGHVYYYRMRTNNGLIDLGVPGTLDPLRKDWESVSEWSTEAESAVGHQIDIGYIGYITWDPMTNFLASGVEDNGLVSSDQHVRLEWDADLNAESYRVHRAAVINGGYDLIGITTNTFFEDTDAIPGYIYYYTVEADAGLEHVLYEGLEAELDRTLKSERTEPIQGKRLWQAITLEATTQERSQLTLNWTPLSGATGYIVYKSNVESGPFRPITNDDATDRIITGTTYIDDEPAKQFTDINYSSPTDGIADGDYIANHRYYFIVVATSLAGLPTVKQYFITSPASGTWTAQMIVNEISSKLTDLDVVICELVPMENLADNTVYKIRFSTRNESEQARIEIIDGTFGDSLLPLLGGMQAAQSGGSAYPGTDIYYRVQAVQIVAGSQVRASEFSNIARGSRPII